MKKTFFALLLVPLAAVALVSCNPDADTLGLGIRLKLEKKTLSNGLVVILVEDHTVPVVSYQSWFRVGSVDEKPGITGISHLFEHLMFKGTPKYGPKQFFNQLEAKGANVNAYTTRDYTVYHETFTPNLLEKVIDMEADRMENLTLTQDVLNTERQVVLEERHLRTENSPSGKLQEALWRLAFQRHPYQWPVIGYMEDLFRITAPELVAYFKEHYAPSNAALVLVGDFDAKGTFELIKKSYSRIPGRTRPKREIRDEPEQREEHRLVMYDHVASEMLGQAYHITAAENDESYAIDVLSNILFEGTTSRAYRLLVEDKDVAAGVSGSSFTPTYPGLFLISATMKGELPATVAEDLLERAIREVQEKGVTEDEVKIAVKQLTVQLVDSVRTPHGLGQLIGTVHTILGDAERFAEDLAKYFKVKPSDVQKAAQKYLVPNNRSVVTLLPESKRPVAKKESKP